MGGLKSQPKTWNANAGSEVGAEVPVGNVEEVAASAWQWQNHAIACKHSGAIWLYETHWMYPGAASIVENKLYIHKKSFYEMRFDSQNLVYLSAIRYDGTFRYLFQIN